MARVAFATYFVRYPLGGMVSHVLEYLVGLQRLGHEVWMVECAAYHDACFDPVAGTMGDDATHGCAVADGLLADLGMGDRWAFKDVHGAWHGPAAGRGDRLVTDADVLIDYGVHGAFNDLAGPSTATVLIDGEPGYNHIRLAAHQAAGADAPIYDAYFTNGRNIGTEVCPAPTSGRKWRPLFHPVNVDRFTAPPPPSDAPLTTVMNWQSHGRLDWEGRTYGQKDVSFRRFEDLPARTSMPLELAVAGSAIPTTRLRQAGWRLTDAHRATITYAAFRNYLDGSAGEFAVCKEVFVALRTGWFSDRSAAYLANGRPVVLQDTGFSAHLPTGEGLFAVDDAEQAAEACEQIRIDWATHSAAARAIAAEHLDGARIMRDVLAVVGA